MLLHRPTTTTLHLCLAAACLLTHSLRGTVAALVVLAVVALRTTVRHRLGAVSSVEAHMPATAPGTRAAPTLALTPIRTPEDPDAPDLARPAGRHRAGWAAQRPGAAEA